MGYIDQTVVKFELCWSSKEGKTESDFIFAGDESDLKLEVNGGN